MLGILIYTPEYGILYRNTGVLGPPRAQHHRDPASRRVEAEHLVDSVPPCDPGARRVTDSDSLGCMRNGFFVSRLVGSVES